MVMRLGLLVLALVAVAAAACSGDEADSRGRLTVVATIAPIGAIATAVGGDLIRLTTLVAAGVDPHDYEVSPADRRVLANASLVLRNGLGLDDSIGSGAGGNSTRVVEVTAGVTVRTTEEGEDDPHVWHDIGNVKVMVENVVNALSDADPVNASRYAASGAAYSLKLDAVDREIRDLIASIPAANRKMVTNHDAFGYFIARYGLTFVGAVIPNLSTQSEPSAKDLAALVDTIRREGVKAIFAESSVDPKVARQIAQDTDVKIVDDLYGDSLGAPGSGADTIEGMLLSNARKIAEVLR